MNGRLNDSGGTDISNSPRRSLHPNAPLFNQQGQSALQSAARQTVPHHLRDGFYANAIWMFGDKRNQSIKRGFWWDSRHVLRFLAQKS